MRLLLICHAEGMQDRYSDLGARNGGLTALGWEQSDALAEWLRTRGALDMLVSDSQLQCRLTAQRIGQAVALPVTVHRGIPLFSSNDAGAVESARVGRRLSNIGHKPRRTTEDGNARPQTQTTTEIEAQSTRGASSSEAQEDGPDDTLHGDSPRHDLPSDIPSDIEDGDRETVTSPEQSYIAYCRELVQVLDDLLVEHWGKAVAVVSGRESIVAILSFLLSGRDLVGKTEAHHLLTVDHTSVTELVFQDNGSDPGWRLNYVNRMEHLSSPVLGERSPRETPQTPPETLENLANVIRIYNRNSRTVDENRLETDSKRVQSLIAFAKLPADQQVLDIGTGLGLLPLLLAEEGAHTVVGVDVSPGMLEQAEYNRLRRGTAAGERVSYRLAAAQALPFHDERFDAVFCRLLLNHAQKPELIIQEAVRVLRPGGVFLLAEILSVDNSVKRATQNAIEERRNPAHVTARSAEQYTKMLQDAGLEVDAEETVTFERELEEWLSAYDVDRADRVIVREMIEAGVETDAAGMNARRQGDTILFVQRLYYARATKPAGDG